MTLRPEEVGRLVHLVPCSVGGYRCFIFRTDLAEQTGGERHQTLEILSAVCLRDALGLIDGDEVQVVV
jgi:CTP-dependent riboflavin kinase